MPQILGIATMLVNAGIRLSLQMPLGIGSLLVGRRMPMKGDRVIVRAYGDVALVRRVWEADDRAVYVTDDATLAKLQAGLDAPFAIGFPREDVFRYEPKAASRIGRRGWEWASLSRYA
jgi:hypothetical protein